jgi:uncharacterized protein
MEVEGTSGDVQVGCCGMKRPHRAKILSLDQLESWFEHAKPRPHCGGVSMMDGFLTGIVIGPVFIHPEKWLWHLVGDHQKRAYLGTKAQAVVDTIVDRYNQISICLAENPFAFAPIFMRTDEGEVSARDWANGFYGAMNLGLGHWKPLFKSFQDSAPLMAILVYCTDPDGQSIYGDAMKTVPPAALEETWRVIPEAVQVVREQCAPYREASESASANTA